jgi:hypothetical protein
MADWRTSFRKLATQILPLLRYWSKVDEHWNAVCCIKGKDMYFPTLFQMQILEPMLHQMEGKVIKNSEYANDIWKARFLTDLNESQWLILFLF